MIPEFDEDEEEEESKPSKMEPVSTESDKCKVTIKWTAIDDNVSLYRLLLQGSDSKWHPLSCTPGGELTTCVVSMK